MFNFCFHYFVNYSNLASCPSSPGSERSATGSFCDADSVTADTQTADAGFRVDLSVSEALHFQKHQWSISPWKEKRPEARFSGWGGAAVGSVIERGGTVAGLS